MKKALRDNPPPGERCANCQKTKAPGKNTGSTALRKEKRQIKAGQDKADASRRKEILSELFSGGVGLYSNRAGELLMRGKETRGEKDPFRSFHGRRNWLLKYDRSGSGEESLGLKG